MTYTCVICLKQYDPLRTRADLKGFCRMSCQRKLEKLAGLRFKNGKLTEGTYAARSALLRKARESTPGAEPVPHIG